MLASCSSSLAMRARSFSARSFSAAAPRNLDFAGNPIGFKLPEMNSVNFKVLLRKTLDAALAAVWSPLSTHIRQLLFQLGDEGAQLLSAIFLGGDHVLGSLGQETGILELGIQTLQLFKR